MNQNDWLPVLLGGVRVNNKNYNLKINISVISNKMSHAEIIVCL